MPYNNVPESMWAQMDKCVDEVMGKGKDKSAAIAICHSSLVKGKEIGVWETLKAFLGLRADKEAQTKEACHYKEATDAPNLRGHGENRCMNCEHYSILPMEGADTPNGLCALHDFISQDNWVCDDWAEIPPPQTVLVEIQAKESGLTVHKQTDGKYRWLIVSSSSFMDKDKEIISQKALEEDTDHMNETGEFGTLDWWHTPIQLGTCDFSAMHGLTRIESGIFHDDFIAEKMSEHGNELAASLSFRHSVTEPDASGVYSHISTFARALLPRGKESNLLTQVEIVKESNMQEEKKQKLVALLGGDKAAEDKVNAALSNSDKAQSAALAADITHKEEAPTTAPEKEPSMLAMDLKPEELVAVLAQGMQKALEPILAEIKEMKAGQATAIKEAGKETIDAIAKVTEKQADLSKHVAALEGLTPRAYRATQDPNTKTDKETTPADDPQAQAYINTFINKFVGVAEGPKI